MVLRARAVGWTTAKVSQIVDNGTARSGTHDATRLGHASAKHLRNSYERFSSLSLRTEVESFAGPDCVGLC